MDRNQPISSNKIPKEKSMQTSGSSEIFDSWTLVTEKSSVAKAAAAASPATSTMPNKDDDSDDANRVEILSSSDKPENHNDDDNKSKSSSVEASEDLSDGISIISDSDSVGRLSPRRSRPKHPNSLDENYDPNYDNLKAEEEDDVDLPGSSSAHTNCCERSSQTSKSAPNEPQLLPHALKKRKRHSSTGSQSSLDVGKSVVIGSEGGCLYPTIRNGLTSFFYVAVLLAILAFIFKLRYPDWQPLVKSSQFTEMEARIIDLELQNNLLCAEFDILSKQVAFMSDRNENNQRFKGKREGMPPQSASRKNPNRLQHTMYNGNGGKFEGELRAWPDDIDLRKGSAFTCNGNKNAAGEDDERCSSPPPAPQSDSTFTNTVLNDQPQGDNIGKDAIIDSAIPNEAPTPTPKPFASPENFDSMNFPQHKNFKPDIQPGHKHGKHKMRKHGGERFDSRENFKRHEKPMKHQKPPSDEHQQHRFKTHPDQEQQQQFRHQHYKPSGEDFNDSRVHGGNGNRYHHQQRSNSKFENDKNRYREKTTPPHLPDGGGDGGNNWYIARGEGRQQARNSNFENGGRGGGDNWYIARGEERQQARSGLPSDEHQQHRFKKYPDQEQQQFRHQHYKPSGEDFNDSRERGNGNRYHQQPTNSIFENAKKLFRESAMVISSILYSISPKYSILLWQYFLF